MGNCRASWCVRRRAQFRRTSIATTPSRARRSRRRCSRDDVDVPLAVHRADRDGRFASGRASGGGGGRRRRRCARGRAICAGRQRARPAADDSNTIGPRGARYRREARALRPLISARHHEREASGMGTRIVPARARARSPGHPAAPLPPAPRARRIREIRGREWRPARPSRARPRRRLAR